MKPVPAVLRELQAVFVAGIYGSEAGAVAELAPTSRLSAARQLEVYRASIFGGLQKVLDETFPVCRQLVGDAFFNHMGWRYIVRTPSRHQDLRRYGEDLAEFIDANVPDEAVPYLADMARLEWACHRARHAVDDVLPPASPVAADVARYRFRLAPHVSRLPSPWPLGEIWSAHQPGNSQDLADIAFDGERRCFVVWREDDVLNIDTADAGEELLLIACAQAVDLAQLEQCYLAAASAPACLPSLATALSRGWLTVLPVVA